MEVRKRIFLIRIVEKIEKNSNYAEKLGVKNKSEYREKQKK